MLQRAGMLRPRLGCIRNATSAVISDQISVPVVNNPFEKSKTMIEIQIEDRPGKLLDALEIFRQHEVNLTRIDSKPASNSFYNYNFEIDFEGSPTDTRVESMLNDLRMECLTVEIPGSQMVPWFPQRVRDLDYTVDTLDGGTDLINDDHPGFHDAEYRARRDKIVEIAKTYKQGSPITRMDYSAEEQKTWKLVFDKLSILSQKYACKEYHKVMPLLEKECGFRADNIPQLQDISDFLKDCTGFSLRPVAGLLSARDFLNALAFRVFFSTQYIRHHSKPLYTPEPDICHELLGHVPLFADPDFADFSQEIGIASLGASDADVARLANCYWFTVEFGLCKQEKEMKAYGAGLLSSFGEMEYACAPTRPAGGVEHMPEFKAFDPFVACDTTYPITEYQPTYFVVESIEDLKASMTRFCDSLKRPFLCRYDPLTCKIQVDRAVRRLPKTSTLHLQAAKQREYFNATKQEVES